MKNETNAKTDLATFEEITYINGCQFIVMKHDNMRYLFARELVDYAGMNWKSARNTLTKGDNVIRYGTKTLLSPQLGEKPAHGYAKKHLFIRADRAYIFMVRVNTDVMRTRGKEEEAEFLLNKQIEWSKVLYAYANGDSMGKNTDIKTLLAVINSLEKVKDPAQKQALNRMINDMLVACGYPPVNPQGDLFNH